MDRLFIQKYAPLYVKAAGLTARIAFFGIVFSLAVGLICGFILHQKIPVLRRIVSAYIELSRNTPLLVQLFFLYYGLPKLGIMLSSEQCAIIGLTFLGGSYMCESIRSGLDSIEPIQAESAYSLGLTPAQTMRHILFPQAIAVAFPAITANMIFLIKETSVVSAIALADLMFVAKDLIGLYYQTDEALFMLVVAYLVLLLPVSIVSSLAERRLRYAGFGN